MVGVSHCRTDVASDDGHLYGADQQTDYPAYRGRWNASSDGTGVEMRIEAGTEKVSY